MSDVVDFAAAESFIFVDLAKDDVRVLLSPHAIRDADFVASILAFDPNKISSHIAAEHVVYQAGIDFAGEPGDETGYICTKLGELQAKGAKFDFKYALWLALEEINPDGDEV